MNYTEWHKKYGNKKRPGMHGVYDSYDMEGRIVVREVYVKGYRVMTLSPIWPSDEEVYEKKQKEKKRKPVHKDDNV